MESLPLDKSASGGQGKIEEYVTRIKGGESKESILQDLPESFRAGILERLAESEREEPAQGLEAIPTKYQGLDAETLDYIWTPALFADEERTRAAQEQKAQAVAALREKESHDVAEHERQSADQARIEELREQLGASKPVEASLQKKEVLYDDAEHRQAIGMYNTLADIAAGAKEGFTQDIERKLDKYAADIRSGKDEAYVLQGLPEHWKQAVRDRVVTGEQGIKYEALDSGDVLRLLAKYCEPYMSAPLEAVADGTFAGVAKLKIENGTVVLVRHAADEGHLIKKGISASSEDMMASSLFRGGAHEAGAVHTSADVENWGHQYQNYPIYGEFRIPVKEFLELGKEGKVIIGNLGEAEIVLSGDVAQKYLAKVIEKNKK